MNHLTEIQEIVGGKLIGGKYLHILCPFHDDTSPSMLVWTDGRFRCLACGEQGTHEKLLIRLGKVPAKKADYRRSRNPFNRWLSQYDDMQNVCYQAHRYSVRYPDSRFYLTDTRGITDDTIDALGIGYLDGYYIFPIKDQRGQIISAVARASDSISENIRQRYILPYGHTPCLYCPDWSSVKKADTVYMVFGIIDAVTLCQLSYPVFTGTNGKSVAENLLDSIRKIIEIIPDQGEEKEGYRLAGNLGWRGKVRLMKEEKDINALWTKQHSLQAIGLRA